MTTIVAVLGVFVLALTIVSGLLMLLAFPATWAWHTLVVDGFHGPVLSYWQVFAGLFLATVLFGGVFRKK